ncbi:hypothetical protein Tco_0365105 [Tanacetum coccineum]
MTLTYQDHSPRERSGLGTMKHTKPETQESSNKNVSEPVTVSNPEPVTSSVPTKVKTNYQVSKINELTKLVQMLMGEKITSTQKSQEPISVSSKPESSNCGLSIRWWVTGLVRAATTASGLEESMTLESQEIVEKKRSSRTHKLKRLYKVGLTARVESSGDEESLGEDASKQGRRINAIDAYEDITLVNVQDDADNEMFDVNVLNDEEVFVVGQNENVVEEVVDAAQVSTAATNVTITTEEISWASRHMKHLKTSKP